MASDIQLGIKITADGKAAITSLEGVKAAISKTGDASQKAEQDAHKFKRSLDGMGSAASAAKTALAGLAAAFGVRELIRTADSYTQLTARLKLASGTTQEYAQALDSVRRIANTYQQDLSSIGQTYQQLAPAVQKLGMSQQDLGDILAATAAGLKVSGTSAGAAAGFMTQFAQALNSSKVQAEEWNSIQDGNLALVNALEKQLPELIAKYGNLKAAINDQAVSNEMLARAVKGARAELEAQAKTMGGTVAGAMIVLSNAWQEYIGKSDKAAGSTRYLSAAILDLAKNLETVIEPVAAFLHAVSGGASILKGFAVEVRNIVREMAGLGDAGLIDPEITDLMRAGMGQKSIDEIAGLTAQAENDTKEFFDGVKRGAADAAGAMDGLNKTIKKSGQELVDAAMKAFKVDQSRRGVVSQIVATSEKSGFDPALLLSIAKTESSFNRLAASTTSTARGVFQFVKGTRDRFGLQDPFNVEQSTIAAIKYLRALEDQFGNTKTAVAAYYSGEGAIQRNNNRPDAKGAEYAAKISSNLDKLYAAIGMAGKGWDSYKDKISAANDQFKNLKLSQDDAAKAAEDYAAVQIARVKTNLAELKAEEEGLQRVTAAQLQNAKTVDEKLAIINQAAKRAAVIHDEEKGFILEEIALQQKALEAKRAAYVNELAGAQSGAMPQDESVTLAIKQAIRAVDTDLAQLAETRRQAEINTGAAVNEYGQQSLALKAQEAQSIAQLTVEYEKQQSILNQLQDASASGATAEELANLASVLQSMPDLGMYSQETLQKAAELNAGIAETANQIKNLQTVDQKFAEEQLRLNAAFEDGVKQAQLFAGNVTEAFGKAGEGIGRLAVSIAQFFQQSYQADRDLGNELKEAQAKFAKGQINEAELVKRKLAANDKAATKSAQYQISLFGEMTDAAKGYFEEGSKGYTALENASKVFRAFEMAMAIKSMLTQVMGINTVTAASTAGTATQVANDMVKGQSAAAVGVATQAQGDPYSAFPRMAAMAAMMAALGFAVAGAFGGGGQSAGERRKQLQESAGTGTVLGDSKAQSESILNALELIKENSDNDLNYSAAMLRALQDIATAMRGVASYTVSGVGPNTMAALGNQYPLSMGGKGMLMGIDPILTKLTLGVSTRITDWGIQHVAQSLQAILRGGFSAFNYTEITKTMKVFTMKVSESVKTEYQALNSGVAKQFTLVIKGIADAVKLGGAAFGLTAADFNQRMKGFIIDFGKVSTAGMTGEEIEKMLTAMFSGLSDRMAKKFMPGLGAFQKIGEGYFQTFVRVGEGITRAKGELAQLGIAAINYADIKKKQGNVDEELFKQSYLASGKASQGLAEFIGRINGTAQELKDAVIKFTDAEYLLKSINLNPAALQGNGSGQAVLIDRVGGLDNLLGLLQEFNDNFLTEGQRTAAGLQRLADGFKDLGVAMPDSKDAFKDLVKGIDTSTDAGKSLLGALLQLAPAFAKVKDQVQSIKDKYADILNPFGAFGAQLQTVGDDFKTLLSDLGTQSQSRRDKIKADMDAAIAQMNAQKAEDEAMLASLKQSKQIKLEAIKAAEAEIAKEEAKKKPNQARIARLRAEIGSYESSINVLDGFIDSTITEIAGLTQRILDEQAKGATADQAELMRLTQERAKMLEDAGTVMTDSLGKIFEEIQATVEAARQKMEAAITFQQSLQTQIAQLQGPGATAALMRARADEAQQAIDGYIARLGEASRRNTEEELRLLDTARQAIMDKYQAEQAAVQALQQSIETLATLAAGLATQIAQLQGPGAVAGLAGQRYTETQDAISGYIKGVQGGATRDYAEEARLLQASQQAVMDRYNAEIALIQESVAAQAEALQAGLQTQIEAINAATEAQIEAINARLEADIEAINDATEAAVKAQQKANEAIIKARQKADDKIVEALQKQQEVALKALQEELDAANKLKEAIKSIADYAQSMKLGAQATLSPEARLAEAQRQYQELLARANAGDPEAMGKLASASDTYLEAAKAYYGSSSQYQNIFDGVQAAMETLGAMNAPDTDSIQSRIDALREAQAAEIERVRELQQEALDLLREQQQDQLDGLREAGNQQIEAARDAAQAQIKAVQNAAQAQIEALQKDVAQRIKDLSDPDKNAAMKALKDAAIADLKELQRLAEVSRKGAEEQAKIDGAKLDQYRTDALAALNRLTELADATAAEARRQFEQAQIEAREAQRKAAETAAEQLRALDASAGFNRQQAAALEAIARKLDPGFTMPAPRGYAKGGYAQAGLAIVGEQGPELVRFERPAQVLTAEQTRNALSGDSPKTFAALDAIKQELKAIVVTQSNANPQLIERLAAIEERLNKMERNQRLAT